MFNFKFSKAKWTQDSEGTWLSLLVKESAHAKQFCITKKDKLYTADIKEFKGKRSLDANAYFWLLVSKMSEALKVDKNSLYIELLDRYGTFTHVVVKVQALEQFKREYRLIKDLGEVTVNGKTGVQLQCFFGSSTYDTKQMSRLIDGTVSECKDLDIETATPEELARMKGEWGK